MSVSMIDLVDLGQRLKRPLWAVKARTWPDPSTACFQTGEGVKAGRMRLVVIVGAKRFLPE